MKAKGRKEVIGAEMEMLEEREGATTNDKETMLDSIWIYLICNS